MLSFFTGISFTPPFLGKQVPGTLHWEKKICVREMAVEVGYSLVVLGATWGALEFYPYNSNVAIILLPTECAASFSCSRVYCIWLRSGCIDRDV